MSIDLDALAFSHLAPARRERMLGLDAWRGYEADQMHEDQGPGSLFARVHVLVQAYRLWSYHTHDSRRSDKGWPDLVIIGARVMYRELKTETGRISADQAHVIGLLSAAGADVDVWRPSDLLAGRIDDELEALTRPGP